MLPPRYAPSICHSIQINCVTRLTDGGASEYLGSRATLDYNTLFSYFVLGSPVIMLVHLVSVICSANSAIVYSFLFFKFFQQEKVLRNSRSRGDYHPLLQPNTAPTTRMSPVLWTSFLCFFLLPSVSARTMTPNLMLFVGP
jgi:hypothetical protein